MADLVEVLKGVGDNIAAGGRGLKNLAAPPGPGQAAPPLGDSPSGPVRYNKDGSPPTPVNPNGSPREITVGMPVKTEKFP
jgi:hypothetical protein